MKKKLFKLLKYEFLRIKKLNNFKRKRKNKICGDEIDVEVEKDFKNIRLKLIHVFILRLQLQFWPIIFLKFINMV